MGLMQYLHGCAYSPSISTFQGNIDRGNFIAWPCMESLNFKQLIDTPFARVFIR